MVPGGVTSAAFTAHRRTAASQDACRKVMPFLKEVAWLGLDFTGYARSEPTIMPDGSLEQVYDNVVLVINPEYPDKVYLLPLAERLGKADPSLQPLQATPTAFSTRFKMAWALTSPPISCPISSSRGYRLYRPSDLIISPTGDLTLPTVF